MNERLGIGVALAVWLAALGGAGAAPWKFAVFCDSRGGRTGTDGSERGARTAEVRPLAQAVAAEQVDLVIVPGDLVAGSALLGPLAEQLQAWKQAMAPVYDARIPVYVIRGNHELAQDASAAVWRRVFPDQPTNGPAAQQGLTYRVDYSNACFVGFDQYIGQHAGGSNAAADHTTQAGLIHPWVLDQVRGAAQPWVFVFAHAPAFAYVHQDCLDAAPAERDALWDALGTKGGVYFCGHDHVYVRARIPSRAGPPVTQFIVGCAGAPHYAGKEEEEHEGAPQPGRAAVQFVNGALDGKQNHNTGGHPPYFGYLVIAVDGRSATGEWKAYVNCDEKAWAVPEHPEFKTLDTFRLSVP